jgi:HSP20 family protein
MALIRWNPWNEVARLRRELDTFIFQRSDEWMPATDVTRDADRVTVKIDLPGMTADDVNVELRDQQLVITGERKQETEKRHEGAITRERVFGSFLRSLELPAGVGADDIQARFANGELVVTVAVPTPAESKAIAIETVQATHA